MTQLGGPGGGPRGFTSLAWETVSEKRGGAGGPPEARHWREAAPCPQLRGRALAAAQPRSSPRGRGCDSPTTQHTFYQLLKVFKNMLQLLELLGLWVTIRTGRVTKKNQKYIWRDASMKITTAIYTTVHMYTNCSKYIQQSKRTP
jgi:ribosomal protein L39E